MTVLRKYVVFEGRARRKEYWMFVLFNLIFMTAAYLLDSILSGNMGYGLIYTIYSLAVLLPGLAVSVRRLHDIGKSGWFILISLIPIIGCIWLLILMCQDGNAGDNKYGPDPKSVSLENQGISM
ncbi:MAG TPA: DUF805 domain-containing protein [Desulfitobacteriaceae bacterium]|nr:DUF805 domain-containing protein [Desulfitobacteriaceae bacterium]